MVQASMERNRTMKKIRLPSAQMPDKKRWSLHSYCLWPRFLLHVELQANIRTRLQPQIFSLLADHPNHIYYLESKKHGGISNRHNANEADIS